MTLGSCTFGWAFTCLLCFKLFHGVGGDCGPPPVIPNTNPVQETSGTPGQTVVYTCDRNTGYYEIPGETTNLTCLDDGTWTVAEKFCTRACGVPERLQFAEPKPGALDQSIFLPNATVSYNCRPGYIRVPGRANSITCLESYTWSTPEIFCQRRSCGHPGEVENGDMDGTDFLFGSRVTYTCNVGYRLVSRRNYRDCLADGTWSNDLPQCEAILCSAPNKPANGAYFPQKDEYTYLDAVTFSCQKPLQIAGNATISCTATGEWSSTSPTCKAVNCPDPTVKNARRLSGFISPYTLNSAISFECHKGYVLNGSSSITCNIDSQWVPAVPTCDIIGLSCGDPGTIPNSQRSFENFFIGSKVFYTCDKGYVMKTTPNYRECQEDGKWTPTEIACIAVNCPDPTVKNAERLSGLFGPYTLNSAISFECHKGYVLKGSSSITCNIDSQWVPAVPTCDRRSCGDPGTIPNSQRSFENFFIGSKVVYTCNKGYVMNTTPNYRECQEDGKWTPTEISCTGNNVAGLMGNRIIILTMILMGNVISHHF